MDISEVLYLTLVEDRFNQRIGKEIVQSAMQMLRNTNTSKND